MKHTKLLFSYAASLSVLFCTTVHPSAISPVEDRALGTLIGMPIGDALGLPIETFDLNGPMQHPTFGKTPRVHDEVQYSTRDQKPQITTMQPGNPFGSKSLINKDGGRFSDDASMGLCLADSLIVNKGQLNTHDAGRRFWLWWHKGYNASETAAFGLGGNVKDAVGVWDFDQAGRPVVIPGSIEKNQYLVAQPKKDNPAHGGNGTLMRQGAVAAVAYTNPQKAEKLAYDQAFITHHSKETAETSRLLAHITCKAIQGVKDKEELFDLTKFTSPCQAVQDLAHSTYRPYFHAFQKRHLHWDWKNKVRDTSKDTTTSAGEKLTYRISSTGYSMATLEAAMWSVYTTNTFEEALLKAVNLGDDADTVGAVTGQIAGAFYGASAVPEAWRKKLYAYDKIVKKAKDLYAIANMDHTELASYQPLVEDISPGKPLDSQLLSEPNMHKLMEQAAVKAKRGFTAVAPVPPTSTEGGQGFTTTSPVPPRPSKAGGRGGPTTPPAPKKQDQTPPSSGNQVPGKKGFTFASFSGGGLVIAVPVTVLAAGGILAYKNKEHRTKIALGALGLAAASAVTGLALQSR